MRRGRPAKTVPIVSDEAVKTVKEMAKSYKKSKAVCAYIPIKRKTLFRIMAVSTENYEATGCIDYRRDAAERIHPDDKRVITNYEERMRGIWLLEHGVAAIQDERTRAIAKDTLMDGVRVERLLQKYGISRRTAFREKKKVIRIVAEFIDEQTSASE